MATSPAVGKPKSEPPNARLDTKSLLRASTAPPALLAIFLTALDTLTALSPAAISPTAPTVLPASFSTLPTTFRTGVVATSSKPLAPVALAICAPRLTELVALAPRFSLSLRIWRSIVRASSKSEVRAFSPDKLPSCVKYLAWLSVAPAALSFAATSLLRSTLPTISLTSPRSAFLISSSAWAYFASSGDSVPLLALLPPCDVVVIFLDFLPRASATCSRPCASKVARPLPSAKRVASRRLVISFLRVAFWSAVIFRSSAISSASLYTDGKSALAFEADTASEYALFATSDKLAACL